MEILKIDNHQEVLSFFESIYFNGPEGKTIMFTNGNSWYINTLIYNLIFSYKKFNTIPERKIGVFCSDKESLQKAKLLGYDCCFISCEKLKVNTSLKNVTDEEYRRLSFVKILIIHYALTFGYHVLYIDPDMSFNINNKSENIDFVNELLTRKHSINYLFNLEGNVFAKRNFEDKSIDTVICGSLLKVDDNYNKVYLNSNLILSKPTEYNIKLFKLNYEIVENICVNDPNGGDETYINRVGRNHDHFSFWNENIYPNGLLSIKYQKSAHIFHANCVKGLHNKIELLKNCGGWYIDFIPLLTTLENWQYSLKPEDQLIVQASLIDGSDGITTSSVGMCFNYVYQKGNYQECQIGNHENLVLCAFKEHTDEFRRGNNKINRKSILKTLESNRIFNKNIEAKEYFQLLPNFKFVISPEGNGIDCHRHYEALLAGCIPIIETNPVINNKYGNCPILFTNDYSEITIEYLEQKYEEMKGQVYDFSRLLLQSFNENQQNEIKLRGNYWCLKCTGKLWYDIKNITQQSKSDKDEKENNNTLNQVEYKSFSLTDNKGIPLDYKLDYIFKKFDGFFIELGANDGITQSNTAFFEKFRNWKGLLIEPSYEAFLKCMQNRPNSICANYACTENNNLEVIEGDFNGNLMSSVNGKRLNSQNLVSVKTKTLESILDELKIKQKIDLLSLDTEGYELNILKGLNLNKYRPRFMLIEIYNKDLEEITNLLKQNNYQLHSNFSNYNKSDNPNWDGTHNDYLFYEVPKICVVSLLIGNPSYKQTAIENHNLYCKKYGYDYICFENPLNEFHPVWMKPEAIESCLNKGYDYVFWMDGDSFFVNTNKRLLDFTFDNYDLLFTGDHNDVLNSGHLLFRNSNWSREFLNEWKKYRVFMNEKTKQQFNFCTHNIPHKNNLILGDQTSLNVMIAGGDPIDQETWLESFNIVNFYEGNNSRKHGTDFSPVVQDNLIRSYSLISSKYVNNIKLVIQSEINSYPETYKHGDFIIHFAGAKDINSINSFLKQNLIT